MFSQKGHTGAMIALVVPDPENYALNPSSGNELPADELHITLAYLGEAADLNEEQRAAVLESVQTLADTTDAPEALFPATTGVFPPADPDEDGSDTSVSVPYYCAPANPERFNSLREDLMVHLSARGVGGMVSQKFPVFSPHVTLTYEPLDAPPDLTSLPTPLPTRFHTIVVKFADEMHVFELDQPVDGPELPLTASIRNELHRLSQRTETAEDYLTALYLRQRQVRSTPAQTRAQSAFNIVASAVDPHHRSELFNRIDTLAERARTEVSPASRLLAANRALALAARTPSPASPTEARELQAITASIRAIIADGNSSLARSLRAKKQLRDRYGRWIEEGGGVRFKIKVPGAPGGGTWYHGTVVGFDIPNSRVNVKLEDGRTVAIPNSKIEQPKAILNMGIGNAVSKAKTFIARSVGKKGAATTDKDPDPKKEESDKAQDDAAVAAMDNIQGQLAETYPDAKVSGGNIAPLVNDPKLIDAETAAGADAPGPFSFVPSKKPAGTANKDAEVSLDKADIDTIRGALDRLTVDFMPSEGDLAALDPSEQAKAKQTARSKAYGRLATLYNERGADPELLRAPSVGTDDQLQEVTEESQPPVAGAPSQTEVLDAIVEANKALFEAVPDADALSGARDKLHVALTDAMHRWEVGDDDDETFGQNLDLLKEFANAQEPSFKPSYAKKNPAEEAFGHFAEDLDNIHASIGGHDNVDQAKTALFDASNLIQSEVDATDSTEDGSPMGWTPLLDELNTEVAAVQKGLDDGFYLNEPEKLINDLNSVSEALDAQSEHLDAEGLDQAKQSLAEAAQNLKNESGDAPDTAPDTDEAAPEAKGPAFDDKYELPAEEKPAPPAAQAPLSPDYVLDEPKKLPMGAPEGSTVLEPGKNTPDGILSPQLVQHPDGSLHIYGIKGQKNSGPHPVNRPFDPEADKGIFAKQDADAQAPEAPTPASEAPEAAPTAEKPAPEAPAAPEAAPEAPAADEEAPGDPADYTDAPDGGSSAEKTAWGDYSEAAGAISDLLQSDIDPQDDGALDKALFKYQGLLNDWYEDTPNSPDATEAFKTQFDEAAVELGKAYKNVGADSDKIGALEDANAHFSDALANLHDEQLAFDADNPDNAEPAAPEAPAEDTPPNILDDLNQVAENLIDLTKHLDDGDPLSDEFRQAAQEVANVGKNLEQGIIPNDDGVEFLDNTLKDLADLFEDPKYGEQLASGDGGQLGDDLEESISDLTHISKGIADGQYGAGGSGNDETPPTANEDDGSPDEGDMYHNLEPAQQEAYDNAVTATEQWLNSTSDSLFADPDFEEGQGAGFEEPVQAQQDFETFKNAIQDAINEFGADNSTDGQLEAAIHAAQTEWTGSEGFKQATKNDEDGSFSEEMSGSPVIDDLLEAAGFNGTTNQADDPWGDLHTNAEALLGELPDPATVAAQVPSADEAYQNLNQSLKALANGDDPDTEELLNDVIAAKNALDDKLQEAIDSPETGPDQKDFVVGAQQHTDEVIESLTSAAPGADTSDQQPLSPEQLQGIINQLIELDTPLSTILAEYVQKKLDNNEQLSESDRQTLQSLLGFVGSSEAHTPQEKADYTTASDALDAAPVEPEVPEATDAPEFEDSELLKAIKNGDTLLLDETGTNLHNAPDALNVEDALAEWKKTLDDFNKAGPTGGVGKVSKGSSWNELSPKQVDNLADIVDTLPSVVGAPLEQALNAHIDKAITDDDLLQAITNALFDVSDKKLRGRLRGAQQGIQQNKGSLVAILRPKNDHYQAFGAQDDFYLPGPSEVAATMKAILKQAASGADFADLKALTGNDADVRDFIKNAQLALEQALAAMDAGDVDLMVQQMQAARNSFDAAIAKRLEVHKHDKTVRRLRARRRALDEITAGFEGHWADDKVMGNPQAWKPGTDYTSTNGFTDRDGNMVYPGDQIERVVKGTEGQTGIVLGWRESNDGKKHGAHLWLDQEKQERPQGVTQKSLVLAAVGPNNPLFHDPSYTGPKVDTDIISEFTPIHEKKQEKQAKKEAKKAAEAAAAPTSRPTTPPPAPGESNWYDGYLDDIASAGSSAMLDSYIESANDAKEQGQITEDQLAHLHMIADDKHNILNGTDPESEGDEESYMFNHIQGLLLGGPGDPATKANLKDMAQEAIDAGEIDQNEFDILTDMIDGHSSGKLVPGTDLSAQPDIVQTLKDAAPGDQITTPSYVVGTDFDTWTKQDDGTWKSEYEHVNSAHFGEEDGPITVVGDAPAATTPSSEAPKGKAWYDQALTNPELDTDSEGLLDLADMAADDFKTEKLSVKEYNQVMMALNKKYQGIYPDGSIADQLDNNGKKKSHFLTGIDSQVSKATSTKDLDEIQQNVQQLYADGVIDAQKHNLATGKIAGKKLELLDAEEPKAPSGNHAAAQAILPDGYPQPPAGSTPKFQSTSNPFGSDKYGPDYVVVHPDGTWHNYSQFPNNNWEWNEEFANEANFAENTTHFKPFVPTLPTNKLHALPSSLTGKSGDGYTEGRHFGLYGGAGIALIHTDENGKKWVLIGQRGDTDTKGEQGSWYLPGGALDEKESPVQGATREFHEEILGGDTYTPNWEIADTHTYTDEADGDWSYHTLIVNADEMANFVPPPDAPPYEFHNFQWVDADQLAEMDDQGLLHGAMSDGKFAEIVGMQPSVSAPEDLTPVPVETPETYTDLPGETPDLAAVVYDMQGWNMVSGSKGSQTGGVYEDAQGNRFYAKRPKSDQHVHSEVLASAMYEALGTNTTLARVGMLNGTLYVVTPWVNGDSNGLEKAVTTKNQDFLNKVRDDFAADVFMGNYDAIGPGYANVIADGNGEPMHVDAGASFFYRGTGGSKSWWGPDPVEWDDMRNGSGKAGTYGTAAKVFGPMTDEQLTQSAAKLLNLSPKTIADMVNSTGLTGAKKKQLIETLTKRRHKILEKAGLLDNNGNVAKDTADHKITVAETAQAVQKATSTDTFEPGAQVTWKIGANFHTGTLQSQVGAGWNVLKGDGTHHYVPQSAMTVTPDTDLEVVNPLANVALIHNGHAFDFNEPVKFQGYELNDWQDGQIVGITSVPGVANVQGTDGSVWSVPFDNIITPEAHAALGNAGTFGKPPTTTSAVSLGDSFAVVPEGSKILKKNVTDWGQELVLVQHPDGDLYVYKNDGTFAKGFGKGPANYKAEKGWVDFQVTMPTPTTEAGSGFSILGPDYMAPPAGSKVLFKQNTSIVPTFIVEHPDGEIWQYNKGVLNAAGPTASKVPHGWTKDNFADAFEWIPTENMIQPGPATVTPVSPEMATAALSTPGAPGSNDGPITKGSFVQVIKYGQGSDPIYGVVVGFNKQTGGWRIKVTDANGTPLPHPKEPASKVWYRSFKGENLQHVGGATSETGPTNVPENASQPTPAAPTGPTVQPTTKGLPTGITLGPPDLEHPLYGTPAPEAPKAASEVSGDMVDDGWMKRAGDAYTARKVSKGDPAKKLEESSYFNSYYAQVKQGSLTALDYLNGKGYFETDPKLYDEAKALIDAHAVKVADAVAKHQAALASYSDLMAEWKAANGQAFYTPLDPKAVKWAKGHGAAHTALMKRFEGVYNKLSAKAKSSLQSQKGSSSWQTKIRLLSKVLGLDRKDVAAHASPSQMDTWDGFVEAGEKSGPVGFAWKGIRTVTVDRFANAAGITLDSQADLTQIIGTIQKDHGAMEFTPGDLHNGGTPGYNSGPVLVDLTVPPEIKGFYTPAGSFSHSGEHGYIAEPGLAMYIWDVKPATYSGYKWEVTASLIPRDVLPYMDNFAGGPATHGIYIPGKTPHPGFNPDGTVKSKNDGTAKSTNDGTEKSKNDGTEKSKNDGSA